jgi:hypothetical protein
MDAKELDRVFKKLCAYEDECAALRADLYRVTNGTWSKEIARVTAENAALRSEVFTLKEALNVKNPLNHSESNALKWMQECIALRSEVETLKKVIAWANNSLYGSHGFFLSDCGGEPNEHHLDNKIEYIKTYSRKTYADLAAAVDVLEQIRHYLMGGTWIFDKSPDEFIRTFLARLEVK